VPEPVVPWSRRSDGLLLALLVGAALASRWLLRAKALTSWDSVLFALSLERYDVGASQPHAPGYPVYVALGRMVHAVVPDANAALVLLGILLFAAATALLYGLSRRFAGRGPAFAATVLFLCSPAALFNSVIATSYPGDAAFSLAVAWLCWEVRSRNGGKLVPWLGLLFGLAGGFRESLLVFLGPLVLWALWPRPWSRAEAVRAARRFALPFAAAVLVWAVPMVLLSGGFADYEAASRLQSQEAVTEWTVWNGGLPAVVDHTARLAGYLSAEAWVLLVALLLAAVAWLAGRTRRAADPTPAAVRAPWTFLAFWTLPAIAFYCLVFSGWGAGPTGYALVFLPGLLVGLAALLEWCRARLQAAVPSAHGKRMAAALVVAAALLPAPGLAAAGGALVQREVADHDTWIGLWQGLAAEYPAGNTSLLASYSWAFARWYFPDHLAWSYTPVGPHYSPHWCLTMEAHRHRSDLDWYRVREHGPPGVRHPLPANVTNVILMDFQLAGENGRPRMLADGVQVEERHLASGWRILLFHPDGRGAIEDYFRVPPNQRLEAEPLCAQP
jgi:hypothetical protein